MTQSRSIRGKRALVTGAASGIGRATAALFAGEGASVAAADVGEAGLRSLEKEARAGGGDLRGWVLDVADDAGVRRVVAEIATALGSIDILVNCAGVSMPSVFGDEEAWRRTLDVNLTGLMRVIREALPHLEKCGEGRVVNIASTEALGATPLISAYTAAKHGVIGLTRSLAVEVAMRGITANAICPGPIRTGMTAAIAEPDKEKFARRKVPLKRYGHPEEIAHAILSLVLPAMSYVTGAVLVVDGGMTALNAKPL
ncbi:MAG TPA: SDR family NAD(P)-dependent oxidoreductase [Candidatus Binatia bacterium]|nr:SDR family NAD(P)-dependent oxidoreductase [Candidatus Binatia bacterium]